MERTNIWAILVALIALTSAMLVVLNSEETIAADGESEYKLTYYGEIEGEIVFNESYSVTSGAIITLRAPSAGTYTNDYTQTGWLYNGVIYGLDTYFTMPDEDITLEAAWEPNVILAANVELPQDASIIVLVVGALFGISAIVGTVIIQIMRKNAMKTA